MMEISFPKSTQCFLFDVELFAVCTLYNSNTPIKESNYLIKLRIQNKNFFELDLFNFKVDLNSRGTLYIELKLK